MSLLELLALVGIAYPVILLLPDSTKGFVKWVIKWVSARHPDFSDVFQISLLGNFIIGAFGTVVLAIMAFPPFGPPAVSVEFMVYFELLILYWLDVNVTLGYGGWKAHKL